LFVSLKIKLPLIVTLLVLLSSAAVGYFLIRHEQEVLREKIRERGTSEVQKLAGINRAVFFNYLVATEDERSGKADSLSSTIDPLLLREKREAEFILLEALNGVINDPWVLQAALFDLNHVLVIGAPESTMFVLDHTADEFTFVAPMLVESDTLAFAQIKMDPQILETALADAIKGIWPVLAGILGVSVILTLLLSMAFTVPITRLKKHALDLAKGDLSSRAKIRSKDELGVLGRVFNKMAGNLQRSYEELKEKLFEIRRLFKMATEDGLTEVYVKRHFLELVAGELQRSIRYERPLSMLMCDIDLFKQVNDTYGHPAGDVVLRAVSRRLTSATREGIDVIGRYGGEEFAIMLPETDELTAWRVAERLRHAVEIQPVSVEGVEGVKIKEIPVTISIGVTTMNAATTLEKLIAAADKALYESKQNGRNRSTSLPVEV
jgi:diguanylate cyclase (GGDEF)-like protein